MKTSPTQMRLTDDEREKLERLRRMYCCPTLAATVRMMIEYFDRAVPIVKIEPKKNQKKILSHRLTL
jgi:hypothetical protein